MSERFVEGHDENIGKGEHANMPKEVYMRPYPKQKAGTKHELDDSMTDIDDIDDQSERRKDKFVSYQK